MTTVVFLLMMMFPGSTTWEPVARVAGFQQCLDLAKETALWYDKRMAWSQPRFTCELERKENH